MERLNSHTNPISFSDDSEEELLEEVIGTRRMENSSTVEEREVTPTKLEENQVHGIEVSFRRVNQPPIEMSVYTPKAMSPDFDVKNVDIRCACGKMIKLQVEYVSEAILPEIVNEPVVSSQDSQMED